jgi:hypothetical protein
MQEMEKGRNPKAIKLQAGKGPNVCNAGLGNPSNNIPFEHQFEKHWIEFRPLFVNLSEASSDFACTFLLVCITNREGAKMLCHMP